MLMGGCVRCWTSWPPPYEGVVPKPVPLSPPGALWGAGGGHGGGAVRRFVRWCLVKATTGFKIALRARFWCVRWRGRGVGVIVVFWVGMGGVWGCGGVSFGWVT